MGVITSGRDGSELLRTKNEAQERIANLFMAIPRTVGLRPNHRLLPALPRLRFFHSGLLTFPIVAQHSCNTFRTSPLCNLTWVYLPLSSCETTCPNEPAERTRMPRPSGWRATELTMVPGGISRSGTTLPGLIVSERRTPSASEALEVSTTPSAFTVLTAALARSSFESL